MKTFYSCILYTHSYIQQKHSNVCGFFLFQFNFFFVNRSMRQLQDVKWRWIYTSPYGLLQVYSVLLWKQRTEKDVVPGMPMGKLLGSVIFNLPTGTQG